MHPWGISNIKLRADRDAMNDAKRRGRDEALCPFCGIAGCASATCEMSRRKAAQQARAQSQAAAAGLINVVEE